ncbi:uncharacterized protein LOC120571287 [Perca fluviatilis]|uniref:uncharacterized protein LOC120571287 n=1 Tax=Perca fluviatilis TaxID=8168 RepID=UPI001962C704|nr:uncharacterized protein LOC120571287 [Perca fluviatilis]
MDILANFLGHDIRVHRQYYRLPEGTMQLAKVSKVLIALEQGRLSDFKGMSLDQIQIDPEEEVPEAMESDLSETEAQESSVSSRSSGSSRSKKRLMTDESDDDIAPTASSTPKRRMQDVESDSDDPKTGTSSSNREQQPFDDPGSVEPATTGPSTSKIRKETESDSGNLKKETAKRNWLLAEVHAVEKTLMAFIECGKVPGKSDCVACIKASPEALTKRTWTAVKFYVKNRITAIQRESARRR